MGLGCDVWHEAGRVECEDERETRILETMGVVTLRHNESMNMIVEKICSGVLN